jgi:UDP-N-acetylglucosamine--N-acetylmuramyl-(pentapeptide) pyrophosphoryl-undecaprenol N-acetylglucosamine transferase
MSTEQKPYRIMISGGGTGGHIYPAISIAQALQEILNDVKILFVGAQGKMEMEKVPEAGFEIVGLDITGIQRSLSIRNLMFPIRLIRSIIKSLKLIRDFEPDAVVGVGGYASGPLLYAANRRGIPTLIQEQNSYAGLTNKWLSAKARTICVAYDKMENYFPKEKLVITGNPVRSNIVLSESDKHKGFEYFGLKQGLPTILIVGGSLGARSVNEAVLKSLGHWNELGYQVIWQTGGFYFEEMKERAADQVNERIKVMAFIKEMKYAYATADLVISRAGALSIAELMLVGKASLLIPSPNVAEDHQTKNAEALLRENAGVLLPDAESSEKLAVRAEELINDKAKREELGKNIRKLAHPEAAKEIANEVIKLIA